MSDLLIRVYSRRPSGYSHTKSKFNTTPTNLDSPNTPQPEHLNTLLTTTLYLLDALDHYLTSIKNWTNSNVTLAILIMATHLEPRPRQSPYRSRRTHQHWRSTSKLGTKVSRNTRLGQISLSQSRYIDNILKRVTWNTTSSLIYPTSYHT